MNDSQKGSSKSPSISSTNPTASAASTNPLFKSISFVIKPGEKWVLDAFCRKFPERVRAVDDDEALDAEESQVVVEEDLTSSSEDCFEMEEDQQNRNQEGLKDPETTPKAKASKVSRKKKAASKQKEYMQRLAKPKIREDRAPNPYSFDYSVHAPTSGEMAKPSGSGRQSQQPPAREKSNANEILGNKPKKAGEKKKKHSNNGSKADEYVEFTIPLKTSDSHNVLAQPPRPKGKFQDSDDDDLETEIGDDKDFLEDDLDENNDRRIDESKIKSEGSPKSKQSVFARNEDEAASYFKLKSESPVSLVEKQASASGGLTRTVTPEESKSIDAQPTYSKRSSKSISVINKPSKANSNANSIASSHSKEMQIRSDSKTEKVSLNETTPIQSKEKTGILKPVSNSSSNSEQKTGILKPASNSSSSSNTEQKKGILKFNDS